MLINTYQVSFTSLCPNNSDIDEYTLEVETPTFLEAEHLTKVVDSFSTVYIFQEDLILAISRELGLKGSYTLKGRHRRVFIVSRLNVL